MYQARSYRGWVRARDLVSFSVVVKETDLAISAATNLRSKAHRLVIKYREMLEKYIDRHPRFMTSLQPLPVTGDEPAIVKAMLEAGAAAGVGPMAAVAGAVAQFVGEELLEFTPEVIVENGGDIYLKTSRKRVVGIYAGASEFTGKIGLEIDPTQTPMGVCASSGTVGHSLSLGQADAAVVLAPSAALADAAATAIGNVVAAPEDINRGIELASAIHGLNGVLIIKGKNMGMWGQIKLCRTSGEQRDARFRTAGI